MEDWRRPSIEPDGGGGECKWRGCVTLSDIVGQEERLIRRRRWGRMAGAGAFVTGKFGVPENSFVWLALRCKGKRGQKMDL